MQQQDGAIMVRIVETPAHEISVGDVILGSLGVAGVMVLAALLLGALLGWLFIIRSRRSGIQASDVTTIW
jgi:hypothetical protein